MSSPVFHLPMTRRRWCAWSGAGLMAWALPGCSVFNHVGPNAMAPQETPPPLAPPPRVAVVLGSGGPRGYAHIGVVGVEYEDADASVPVPVSVARRLGARFVIAVDVSARRGTTPVQAPAWKKARDEARWQRIEPEVRHADFLFHPDLDYDAGPWPSYFRMARVRGELHASDRLPALLRALSEA